MSPTKKRRQYDTGSITRPDGKWLGRLEAGFTDNGTVAACPWSPPPRPNNRRLRDKGLELEREGPGAVTTTRPHRQGLV